MKMAQFDQLISRRNTNSIKWDSIATTYQKADLLPLWIADMDFKAPQAVQDALQAFVQQGIFGYTLAPETLYQAIIDWQRTRHHYHLEKADILFNSGVVPSIAAAIQAYTEMTDAVLINNPVYPPFAATVKGTKRTLIQSPLLEEAGQFRFDFADMEAKIIEHHVKLFILCNPHNPGGRVWTKEELRTLGQLCQKHQVLVVSDEIHQDLVFPGHQFHSFQTIQPDFSDFSIILAAPTKTFNLAGIKHSMLFIKNPILRQKITALQEQAHLPEMNTFGYIATEAAYTAGHAWLDELLIYLKANEEFTFAYFTEHLPHVRIMRPEGTYLMWLDFSAYGLSDQTIQRLLLDDAGVVLNNGATFGTLGKQHVRLNIACPKATLATALEKICYAFSSYE